MKNKLDSLKCYMCGNAATSMEHVPPLCLFPEKKNLYIDLRINLIKVPSCDLHNMHKTKEDEFLMVCLSGVVGNNVIGYLHAMTKVSRALARKNEGFFNKIVGNAKGLVVISPDGKKFPILKGNPDYERLLRCFEHIAAGLYNYEFKNIFKGKVGMLMGFIEYKEENNNKYSLWTKKVFETKENKDKIKGANQDVFYYQVLPPDYNGLVVMRMVFYGGTDVYVSFVPEGTEKPFDLTTALIQGGFKTIVQFDDGNIEFN